VYTVLYTVKYTEKQQCTLYSTHRRPTRRTLSSTRHTLLYTVRSPPRHRRHRAACSSTSRTDMPDACRRAGAVEEEQTEEQTEEQ
jgi:hypothetical protein